MNEFSKALYEHSISVISTNVNISKAENELSEVVFFINAPKRLDVKKLTADIKNISQVDTIVLKEKAKIFN